MKLKSLSKWLFVLLSKKIRFINKNLWGEINGEEIIGNDLGRIVAVISYYFGKTSRMLEKLVFGGRNLLKKHSSTT